MTDRGLWFRLNNRCEAFLNKVWKKQTQPDDYAEFQFVLECSELIDKNDATEEELAEAWLKLEDILQTNEEELTYKRIAFLNYVHRIKLALEARHDTMCGEFFGEGL